MAETKEKDSKKTMDINAPGKAAPSATSRPIIINHGPMMTDPMVQKEVEDEDPKGSLSSNHKTIEPATLGSVQKKAEEKVETPPEEPAPEPPKPETEPSTEPPKESETSTESNTAESSSEAEVDAVAGQAGPPTGQASKKKEDEATKAEEERKAKLKQLITERKYFVPLGVAHHKKANRISLVILVLLVLIAGAVGTAYYMGLNPSTLLE